MDQNLWGKVPLGRQLATQGRKLVAQLSLTEIQSPSWNIFFSEANQSHADTYST